MSYQSEGVKKWRKKVHDKDPEILRAMRRKWDRKAMSDPVKRARASYRTWVRMIKRQYGLTEEQWYQKLNEQGGNCELCGQPPIDGQKLAVDHNHETGRVRGLVHNYPCNIIIGQVENFKHLCDASVAYLEKYK